nr:MAG TPA: hypothetical protein [Caudoviricetes sp.]
MSRPYQKFIFNIPYFLVLSNLYLSTIQHIVLWISTSLHNV